LNFENNASTTFNHQRYVTYEMQRVAKPLLGMQEDAPASKDSCPSHSG